MSVDTYVYIYVTGVITSFTLPLLYHFTRIIGRSHMTIGMTTGLQTRCDDRFANRSSCVNSQIHCFQTGRHTDRRPARCVNALAIGMTTGLQTYAKYLAAHWLTVYQWSWRHVLTLLNIIIIIYLFNDYYLLFIIYLFIYLLFIIYLLFFIYYLFIYHLFNIYLLL